MDSERGDMCETEDDVIRAGQYVIVKKSKFKKVYRVVPNGVLRLRKSVVQMDEIIGKRFWTTFAIVSLGDKKGPYRAVEVTKTESLNDLLTQLPSGSDNRSIMDDGTSQKLSKEEIVRLQESGKSGREIVGSLIRNNRSFLDRTEYSQKKYLKKKEQKYLKYITICKPTISLLHDSFYTIDCTKISSIRMDTLAQFLSYSDVQSDGLYILYDSGSSGLSAAAMLNRIGANTDGRLIYLSPEYNSSHTIINAMNFPAEQLQRLIYVNIYTFLKLYRKGESAVWKKHLCEGRAPRKKSKRNASRLETKRKNTAAIASVVNVPSERTDVQSGVVNVIQDNVIVKTETADVPSESMDVESDVVNVIQDNVNVKTETADVPSESMDVQSDVVNVIQDNVNVKTETADVSSESMDIQSDTVNELSSATANKTFNNVDAASDVTNGSFERVNLLSDNLATEAINGSSNIGNEVSNATNETNEVVERDGRNRGLKRKLSDSDKDETLEAKAGRKPKWLLKAHDAVDLVRGTKARGLAIVANEHPENIVSALLPFLGASRPFVIYHGYKEPLQETYMSLKQKHRVLNLKLLSNFLRSYQVLPDRTHPNILTTGAGGFLLTGYLVEK